MILLINKEKKAQYLAYYYIQSMPATDTLPEKKRTNVMLWVEGREGDEPMDYTDNNFEKVVEIADTIMASFRPVEE